MSGIRFRLPAFRINNRARNIAFFEQYLGLTLLQEEGALVYFGTRASKDYRLLLEESPSSRTRAVEGPHKLKQLILKADVKEIEQLLARDIDVEQVYKGEQGYAYQVTSPEGIAILLHGEDNLDSLVPVEHPQVEQDLEFQGLTDFTVTSLQLNVPDKEKTADFYDFLFSNEPPLDVQFIETEGADLQASSDEVWDLEILEFIADSDVDLTSLAARLREMGHSVYTDSKEELLVVSDVNGVEIWIGKA